MFSLKALKSELVSVTRVHSSVKGARWFLLSVIVLMTTLASSVAQSNKLAETKRFIRGIEANPPVLKSFVIPLDFQKGVELDAMGNNAAKFPGQTPWFIQVPREQRYHFGLSGTAPLTIDYLATPFENPIVAFGTGAGGTPLYINKTYRFGIHGGPLVQTGAINPYAMAIWVTAYRKSDLAEMGRKIFTLPRRNSTDSTEKARWNSYINNGKVWPTREFPEAPFYGLTTSVEFVEGGLGAVGWGVGYEPIFQDGNATYQGYILSQSSASSEYYYKVEAYTFLPLKVGGGVANYPMAGTVSEGTINAAGTILYALNFDAKPVWKSTDIDRPHFQGEPMPPEYAGKALKELLEAQTTITQAVTGSSSTYGLINESPELREHPLLNQLVTNLIGNLPTAEQKAIALANYVQNEIELCDPINYNESGDIEEASINPGGVSRGALATYLEGQGSPTEQAALLVYMFRKAGIPAAYLFPAKNKLKMLDARMSSILRFQIRGVVDNLGDPQAPFDPNAPSLVPVNYPWVTAYINNTWVHFFPWIKDTEVIEGYNFYNYMPTGYKNGQQWVDKYLNGDAAILNLGDEDKTPGSLFPKFITAKLKENHPELSLDDMGVRFRDRKNYYSRLQDFPKPFELTGIPTTVKNLSDRANIFDTVKIKVSSAQTPTRKLETAELPILEFHNRKLLLRQTKVSSSSHSFSLTLAPFQPTTSGTGNFTNNFTNLARRQVINGSSNLTGADRNLKVEIEVKRHKRYHNSFTIPEGQWDTYLGFIGTASNGTSVAINKGDLAAICLSVGRVSDRMMEEHAKEFWQMQQSALANPTGQDPDVYQGTAAYLMGMSFYNRLDNFTQLNARLHKRNTLGSLSMGLAVLKAEYVNGALPSGNIRYVQPFVDMFYTDVGSIGNETIHPDSGSERIPSKKDFETINVAAGSAYEHQVIDTYFQQGDAISTVELLRIAKNNPGTYPQGFYELTINNYMSYNTVMASYDSSLWQSVKNYFEVPGSGKYVKVYITSKPVAGAGGNYTGMGALIFSVNEWGALISKNLNGGSGSNFSNLNAFTSSNVSNLSLDRKFSDDAFSFSLSYAPPSTPSAPVSFFEPTPSWDLSSTYSSIYSGALRPSASFSQSLSQAATDLGYAPTGSTAAQIDANNYSRVADTGNAGAPGYNGVTGSGDNSSSWSLGSFVSNAVSKVSTFVGDPVNVVTGEFYIDAVDLKLNGPMPLEIRRNYSSQNLAHNNFGYGWRWAYFPYLVVGNNADVIHAAEMDGSVIVYRKQSGGTQWKPNVADNPHLVNVRGETAGSVGNPFNAEIVKSTSGGNTFYDLTGSDGSKRRFKVRSFPTGGANGVDRERPYLDRWEDSRGNYFQFTFQGDSTQPGYGEVQRIDSSNGNFVGFDYDIYGHIIQAYAGDGRRLSYRYDNFGDLVNVTLADASAISYEYKHGAVTLSGTSTTESKHLIIREVKPDGRVLENDYDTSARVTEQRATVGEDLIPVRNARFAYTQTINSDDSVTGNTIVRDAYYRDTRYEYTNSQITLLRDPLNKEIKQEWYSPTDATTGAYPRSIKKRTDKRGLITEFKYDTKGNLVEQKVKGDLTGTGSNDTATTTYAYNTLNLPTETVDSVGNSIKTTYGNATYPWLPTALERWTSSGMVSRTLYVYTQVTQGTAPNQILARGLLASKTVAEGSTDAAVTDWTYNAFGFPATSTQRTGSSDPNIVKTYAYNLRGELVEEKDSLGRKKIFAYDGIGRRTWEEFRNETGTLLGWNSVYYNSNGEAEWADGPRYNPEDYKWMKYDGAGRLIESSQWRSVVNENKTGVAAPFGDDLFTTSFYRYDLFGNQVEIRDMRRNTIKMTYDGIGRMADRKFYEGTSSGTLLATESWTYEPGDKVATYTSPLGGVTSYLYTSTGQVRRQTNPDGSVLNWRYYLDGRVKQEPVNNNTYWEITYNDFSRTITRVLKSVGGASLATETKVFDRRGNCISQTDAENNTFTKTYDDLDRPKTETGPVATSTSGRHSLTYTYDATGKVTTVANALGEKNTTTSDVLGRTVLAEVRNSSNGLVKQTSYTFAPDHNSVTVTAGSGAGSVSTTTYTDTLGKPLLTVNGDGAKTVAAYDAGGNMLSSTDELGRTTNSTYDGLNRLKTQTLPDGAVIGFVYDAAGNLKKRQMPGGLNWNAQYDSAGRIQNESLVGGTTTTRSFSYIYYSSGIAKGKLQKATDPRGIEHTTTYDAFLRSETVVSTGTGSPGSTVTYTYDNRSLPTKLEQVYANPVNGPPVSVALTYDGYGQTTGEIVKVDGQTHSDIALKWDAAGRRLSLNEAAAGLASPLFSYQYQADGKLTQLTANGQNYGFGYGNQGFLTSRTNPFRAMTVNQRDGAGRITRQTVTAGAQTPLIENLTWRADSTLNSYSATRSGTGAWNESRSFGYNNRGQLLSEGFSPAQGENKTLNYTFDGGTAGVGVRTTAQVGTSGTNNWQFSATEINSVARVTGDTTSDGSGSIPASGFALGAQSVEIELDGIPVQDVTFPGWMDSEGKWTATLNVDSGTHTLTAKAHHPSGQYTSTTTSTFTVQGVNVQITNAYDAAGNVVSRTWATGKTQVLSWDADGRLIKVAQRDSNDNGFDWSAVYDSLGRRLKTSEQKIVANVANGTANVISSIYDPLVEFLEIGISAGGQKAWKVYGPDLDGSFGSLQGIGGLEAVIVEGDGATGIINDFWGNAVASRSGSSAVVWNTTRVGGYGPLPKMDAELVGSAGDLAEATVWRGKRLDATGFYYLGARYYEPGSGRFLSADPFGHAGSMSLYDYANGDPVNGLDPDGRVAKATQSWMAAANDVVANTVLSASSGTMSLLDWSYTAVYSGFTDWDGGRSHLWQDAQSASAATNPFQQAGHYPQDSIYSLTRDTVEFGAAAYVFASSIPALARSASSASSGMKAFFGMADDRAVYSLEIGAAKGATGAESALQGARLNQHLSQLEKYGSHGTKQLENGAIRYYGEVAPATNTGEMVGRRLVREWNPATGAKRTWHETLDGAGTVRQVRPVTDGPKVHYRFDAKGNYIGSW